MRPPDGAKVVRYDDYIDEKIESTRRMVKVVDLATAFVELAVATLLFLLAAIVTEHWLVRGGFSVSVRTVLFTILVAGSGYFAFRRLWPLCVRAINPVYAAHTIEHGSPSLKNGLVNLLMFRQRRSEISDAVYRTLEEQAAHGLTRVPVDTAVDRSQLIHLGYVLIAIVAVAALYKVFSPKDPLVTAERVLMPWADLVPASRVTISAIKPGAATISRGEFVDVSADVRGLSDDDTVVLRYTTDDGQVVDRAIPLKVSADDLRFSCRLADEAEGSANAGVSRNLKYWLEAGDARSLDYAITVVPAASILVERVDYDYPAYTGYVDQSVDGIGDVRAIEGTRVTVHARANGAIREANVDFDADGRRDLQMTAAESKAHASFELALREDRQTPRHASYVLRFTNDEGRTNHAPVKHSINVEPDRQPEAEIRLPREKVRDARLDENVTIEVEARDPDFALSAVRLRGEVSGRPPIDEPLLKGEHRGQFNGRYVLTPAAHGLRAGDVLEYWVEADDNRTPKPNTIATEHKSLRIVSPDPAQQPPPDQIAQNDRQQRDGAGEKSDEAGGKADGKSGGEEAPARNQDQPGAQGEQGQQGSDSQGQQSKNEGQGQAGGQSATNNPSPDKPDQQKNQGEQSGAGAEAKKGELPSNGDQQNGQQQTKPSEEQSPVSSEGDNDAEAFNRIEKHLEKKGELKQDQDPPTSAGESASADGKADGKTDGKTDQKPQNSKSQQPPDANSKDRGEGKGAETRGDDSNQKGEPKGEQQNQEKSPGGEQSTSKGAAGDGNEEKSQGAPNSKPEMKPTEKPEQAPSKGEKTNQQEPPAGANSKRESDSHGDEGGDKAGGGEEGGGQKAPREGTGSAGQNQSADNGAGESGEKGKGDNSPNAGRDAKSDHPTGSADGKTPGEGSQQRDGTGDKPGGKPGGEDEKKAAGKEEAEGKDAGKPGGEDAPARNQEQPFSRDAQPSAEQKQGQGNKEPGKQEQQPQDATAKQEQENGDKNESGAGSGANGQPGGAINPQPSATGETPEGDAANLEYSRKQTDLVLDKLAEQLSRKRVDDGLLKEVGWSEAELRRFVERWQQRKAAAERNDEAGEAAKRELDDALRSLGLHRGELRQNAAQKDSLRDLREAYRGPVPAEYKERLRAYNQGVSRARPDGE